MKRCLIHLLAGAYFQNRWLEYHELIRRHDALLHQFTKAVGAIDNYHILEAAFRIQGEGNTRYNAKYKAGNYTLYNAKEDLASALISFPNILFVSVQDLDGVTLRFSDVAAVEKDDRDYLQYVRKGDTLLITGKASSNINNGRNDINISVPNSVALSAVRSSLFLQKSKEFTAINCSLQLRKSQVIFSGTTAPFQLGGVSVVASDSSAVSFQGHMQVNKLNVQLSRSALEYTEGAIGQLTIQTDSASHISLQAKHLAKASIKTVASQ